MSIETFRARYRGQTPAQIRQAIVEILKLYEVRSPDTRRLNPLEVEQYFCALADAYEFNACCPELRIPTLTEVRASASGVR